MTLLNSTTFADHTNNYSILSGVFESNFGMGGEGWDLEWANPQKFKFPGMLKL